MKRRARGGARSPHSRPARPPPGAARPTAAAPAGQIAAACRTGGPGTAYVSTGQPQGTGVRAAHAACACEARRLMDAPCRRAPSAARRHRGVHAGMWRRCASARHWASASPASPSEAISPTCQRGTASEEGAAAAAACSGVAMLSPSAGASRAPGVTRAHARRVGWRVAGSSTTSASPIRSRVALARPPSGMPGRQLELRTDVLLPRAPTRLPAPAPEQSIALVDSDSRQRLVLVVRTSAFVRHPPACTRVE